MEVFSSLFIIGYFKGMIIEHNVFTPFVALFVANVSLTISFN
uniref:Uncharacterized protein n=1 Tax=Siphoviridae sp. ctRlj31 TaxID=2826338 RepID=A0A8S5N6G6_9CAUD|nr:MAG TPA: hypothetical protein [Siphoviridae sp. ctRlj31]DAW41452.1 MAG TPA: hypothetical protein [Caudoviricetes sp.]